MGNKNGMHASFSATERELTAEKEIYTWLFVNTIPLLYEKKKIEHQSKIENWLNLYQLTREIDMLISEKQNGRKVMASYVI